MTDKHDETSPKAGYIPKPPSPAELDQVSRDQALITDEWADAEQPTPSSEAAPPKV